MSRKQTTPLWSKQIEAGFAKLSLAITYIEDGAFLTGADRLDEAAAYFRDGFNEREKAFGIETDHPSRPGEFQE